MQGLFKQKFSIIVGENLQTVRENTVIFIKASKDIGSEVNFEKTKYMITSHQNEIQNQNIVIGNLSFENVEKFTDIKELQ